MVDDNREEHRMMIFGNDSDSVQKHLIRESSEKGRPRYGILERKIHADSYTVTLYALLKDYGLTPIVRIKPRIRFHRSNYDNLSSSAPLAYSQDDIVHFAELKRGVELIENVDVALLERVFGDGRTIEDLSADPALQLVSQRDVFLGQPPFKTKTKVFGEGSGVRGIPIGKFLDALNQPTQTEKIFKQFPRGDEFAKDLLEALESFRNLEFKFGLYSRYERRDCVLAKGDSKDQESYRTTFDPWTALGYIRLDGDMQQCQILSHERGTRWEHKIIVEQMTPQTLELISQEIRALRRENLIGRIISKSLTGLTLLAESRESRLNLTQDLFVGYNLKVEVPIPNNRFPDIEHRKKLRAAFNSNGQYQLHPFNREMIEKHCNLAKGAKNGMVYTLNNTYLMQSPSSQRINDNGVVVIREPIPERVVMRSAQDLRNRIPDDGFERCWNETIDEGGYTIISKKTSRCYTVSYGIKATGSILDGKITKQDAEYYLSIKYLGVISESYAASAPTVSDKRAEEMRESVPSKLRLFLSTLLFLNKENPPSFFDAIAQKENEVVGEMKNLTLFLKNKQLI